jgi:hypothetical protein
VGWAGGGRQDAHTLCLGVAVACGGAMRDGDVQSGAGAVFVLACNSTATVDNVDGVIISGGHRTQSRGRKRSSDGSLKGIEERIRESLLEHVAA